MDLETTRALAEINRAFYRERAAHFAAHREHPWPGWSRVLACLEAAPRPLRVLDVGCGNGRLAGFLGGRLSEPCAFVGVDASEELLSLARARHPGPATTWLRADWVEAGPERALPAGPFSLVALFGVLHHVPGAELRGALLEAAARRLAPGGLLALTAWRFEASERLRARVMGWDEYNRAAARPVDPARLEPGDRLLRWGEPGGRDVRYCHFAADAETDRLGAELGLERLAAFHADGRGGDLNRYLILRARP
jgi:tRNA (uracil-5-)-methyltransferase TRM9